MARKKPKKKRRKPEELPVKSPIQYSVCFDETESRISKEIIGSNGFMYFNRDFLIHMATALGKKPAEVLQAMVAAANIQEKIVLDIEPMPTPRPRGVAQKIGNKMTARVYHPAEYTDYKIDIHEMLAAIESLQQKRYYGIAVVLYLPFPKGEAKKRTYENRPHEKKPDFDNLVKGFVDALVSSGVVIEDGNLHTNLVLKRYTTQDQGRVEFTLYSYATI